ncbi:hypothetical protein M407DRAFT_233247 [Tulasnella calospora MUT 4182]|uniref:F-box domain-containing protein n=1 Tax=Tulasnella calospora MUT 4182 TaxID=1051891 RepID=A0A0C3QAH6_9AGAM|nr:hypothetical protein M407DRAFT_233247 [Tulasnella calospora MUT 4182]
MSASAFTLPPELWIQIAYAIKTHRWPGLVEDGGISEQDTNGHSILALQNLSLSSKSLLEITRPILFETITIIGSKADSLDRAKYFGQLLASNPLARNWIKDLTIISPHHGTSSIHAQMSDILFDSLSSDILMQTTSLRSLTLHDVELTHDLLFHLLQLSHSTLQQLILDEVAWSGLEPSSNLVTSIRSQAHTLKTTDLAIRQRLAKGFDPILPIIILFSLSPNLKRLSLDHTSAVYVYHLSSQTPLHNFQSLLYLEVPEPMQSGLEPFMDFLNQCSNIVSMKLIPRWVSVPRELEWPAPIDVTPRLREYSGPYSPARLLLRGRPVEILCIQTGSIIPIFLSQNFLESLNQGSTGIRHLELCGPKWEDKILSSIFSVFRDLESLTLTDVHYQKGSANLLAVFLNTPVYNRLRQLRLSSANPSHDEPPHAPTIQKQRTIVQNATQIYPALEDVSLLSGVFWLRPAESDHWIVNFDKERTRRLFEPKVDSIWRLFNHNGELLRHASLGLNRPGTQP